MEKTGFHASWTTSTDGQKCEGELVALNQPQVNQNQNQLLENQLQYEKP